MVEIMQVIIRMGEILISTTENNDIVGSGNDRNGDGDNV